MRMLAPTGNPRADNLFAFLSFLHRRERVRLEVKVPARVETVPLARFFS